jgi:hypothetical protein
VSKLHRLLIAGLTVTAVSTTVLATPSYAAEPTAAAAAAAAVADPTELATDEDKVEAARALGINPGIDMLVLNDQDFVFSLWRQAPADSFIKAEALRAYDDTDPNAAYAFIKTGIFAAAADDRDAEIAAEQAKALRRSVAVTVGLDAADIALVEKGDEDFIFAVWQLAKGERVKAAAQAAIAVGSDQEDWTAFLTTGAQVAADQDMREAIDRADELEKARLRAEQLATAKRALLQLLLLPVTEELVNAPNRQYVLHVQANAKGTEVKLAAQAAINAADIDPALSEFIFTGGAAANLKDEKAAAARDLAGYRNQVTALRDAAKLDGWLPKLVAAADRALADNTLLGLQTFLLKGQDTARAQDTRTWSNVALSGDRIAVLKNNGTVVIKEGGLSATWVNLRSGVKQVVLAGDRIGVLATDGTAYVKDGTISAAWVAVRSGVKQIALSGDRIGVVTKDNLAFAKAGALNAAWVQQASSIKQIALAGTRIGVLSIAGNTFVKEGSLTAGFDQQSSTNAQISLTATRVGVLSVAANSWVKEGALTNSFVQMSSSNKQIALSGDRVGVLSIAKNAFVKDGTLSAAWVLVRPDVAKLAIDGNRVGVLAEDGGVYVKDGGLSAAWVTQTSTGPLT